MHQLHDETRGAFGKGFTYIEQNPGPVPKAWLVQYLVGRHSESFADEFGLAIAYDAMDRLARAFLNGLKLHPQDEFQIVMPGFKHLQLWYLVARDGESVVVRTEDMTIEEFDAQIAMHEAQAAGHRSHAEELRRYKAQLFQAA